MRSKRAKLFCLYLTLIQVSIMSSLVAAENSATENSTVENPLSIIKTATDNMLIQLHLNEDVIAEDHTVVIAIVENVLMPHFASNTISRKVLGKHIKNITKEQKQRFSVAFRFYMVRFYANLFSAYSNQTFRFMHPPNTQSKKKVTIKTHLIQAGSKPISIDYKMQRGGNSWKIIDLKIEGISMMISNRKQFGYQISKNGIETVIAKLEYKNRIATANE